MGQVPFDKIGEAVVKLVEQAQEINITNVLRLVYPDHEAWADDFFTRGES
jgi:hypothetical protein